MRLVIFSAILLVAAGCTSLNHQAFADQDGAIRGYDPVAYFTDGQPVKGRPEISYDHFGATWHFASEDNRRRFAANPEKYAPQYGGYCAYAMSKGFVVSIDPEAWSIRDDKLYLNYSPGVRRTWLKDPAGYIEKADGHWARKLETGIDDE